MKSNMHVYTTICYQLITAISKLMRMMSCRCLLNGREMILVDFFFLFKLTEFKWNQMPYETENVVAQHGIIQM